jgi:hypothetical protein
LIALAGIANGGEREGKEKKKGERLFPSASISDSTPKPRFLIITFD